MTVLAVPAATSKRLSVACPVLARKSTSRSRRPSTATFMPVGSIPAPSHLPPRQPRPPRLPRLRRGGAVALVVSGVPAAMWGVFRARQEAPDFKGLLPSVSYAPFEGTAHPDVDNIPSVEKIRADMKKLSTLTRAIRLYSSTGGGGLVPPIAAEFGLKSTVGAWIDKNVDRN